MTTMTLVAGAPPRDRLEWTAVAGLLGFVAALQLSIAAAGICLARHAGLLGRHAGAGPGAMGSAAVLLAAAGLRGVDAGVGGRSRRTRARASSTPSNSSLFLLVPAVYKLARGNRALTVFNVIITVGAASAILGIVQYGMFNYDHLGQRPQGTLGHYMTYSGLLVLVICAAVGAAALRRRATARGRPS